MPIPLLIAGKDLRQRLRDRSALVVGIVAPLVIAAVMSLAFKGVDTFHFTLGVVDEDHGTLAAGLVHALQTPELHKVLTIETLPSTKKASAAVRTNTVQAALVIPAHFSSSLAGSRPLALRTLTSVNNAIAGNVTSSIANSFVAQLNADRLSVATALGAGTTAGATDTLQAEVGRLQIPEQLVQRQLGSQPLQAISYFSPAMAIFFLFFTISYTARSFFVDRDQGMVERMRAAPIAPIEILWGKALSVFVFGAASLGVIALVTSVAFGANWGSPLAAGLVLLSMVMAVVALTALAIGLARTQRQADGISSAIVFGLALLGGNFVFLSAVPDVMKKIALFTPNGWALRAFTDLGTGAGLRAVVTPVLAILTFTTVVAALAALLARRAVTA